MDESDKAIFIGSDQGGFEMEKMNDPNDPNWGYLTKLSDSDLFKEKAEHDYYASQAIRYEIQNRMIVLKLRIAKLEASEERLARALYELLGDDFCLCEEERIIEAEKALDERPGKE